MTTTKYGHRLETAVANVQDTWYRINDYVHEIASSDIRLHPAEVIYVVRRTRNFNESDHVSFSGEKHQSEYQSIPHSVPR